MAMHFAATLLGLAALSFVGHSSSRSTATADQSCFPIMRDSSLHYAIDFAKAFSAITERSIVERNLNLSLELLKHLEEERECDKPESSGVFFSPLSIWSALLIASVGAKGNTELEFQSLMGTVAEDKVAAWAVYFNLLNLNAGGPWTPGSGIYAAANKLYFPSETKISDHSRKFIQNEIDLIDFSDSEAAAEIINSWVESETNGRISTLVPPQAITPSTKMIFANAVYLKALWKTQFVPSETVSDLFCTGWRQHASADMMSTRSLFNYGVSSELKCSAIELPYEGNKLSMIVLLPDYEYSGVGALVDRLTADTLQIFLQEMTFVEVFVSLPKFKLEENIELSKVLKKEGLRAAFNRNQSDFSGFNFARDLVLNGIYHKTFISFDEQGTGTTGSALPNAPVGRKDGKGAITFIANHPFIFFIKDNRSNAVLFMGTLQKP